jgi:hypothetical protein
MLETIVPPQPEISETKEPPSKEGAVVADLPADLADTRGFLKKLVDGGMSRDQAVKELQRQRQLFWDQNDLPEGSLVHAPNAPGVGLDGGQDNAIFEKQSDGSWILLDKKGDFTKVKHPRIEALAGGTVQRVGKATAPPAAEIVSERTAEPINQAPFALEAAEGSQATLGSIASQPVSPLAQDATQAPEIKPSREVPVHVIKNGIRTTENRQPTPKLLSELVSQKKIYTLLRNCLNS